MVTTLLGLLFGGVYAHLASTSYRSSALLLLDAHPLIWETGTPKGNELQISQQEFVSSVMAAQDLYHLKCFDDFSAEQALKATLRNIEVVQNPSQASIFRVNFNCSRAADAQTILDHLVASYKRELTNTKVSSVRSFPEPTLDSATQAKPKDAVELEFIRRLRAENEDPAFEVKVIEPASIGEQVLIFRRIIWGVSGLVGFLSGVAIITCIFMYSRSIGRQSLSA